MTEDWKARALAAEAALESMTKERERWRLACNNPSSEMRIRELEAALESARAEATKAEALTGVLASALDAIKEATFDNDRTVCAIAQRGLAVYRSNRRLSSISPPTEEPQPKAPEPVEWCAATIERSFRSCLGGSYRCRGMKGHGGEHYDGDVFWPASPEEPTPAEKLKRLAESVRQAEALVNEEPTTPQEKP